MANALPFFGMNFGYSQTKLDSFFQVIHTRAASHKRRASKAATSLFYGLASLFQEKWFVPSDSFPHRYLLNSLTRMTQSDI